MPLQVTFSGPGTLLVDQVSLFPSENVRRGEGYLNPWPFRQDLLDAMKGLHPRCVTTPTTALAASHPAAAAVHGKLVPWEAGARFILVSMGNWRARLGIDQYGGWRNASPD